jgi:hypothetical protein
VTSSHFTFTVFLLFHMPFFRMTTLKKKSSHGAHRLRETRRSLKGCRKARSIWCPGWADKTEDELKEVGMTDTEGEETLPGHGTRSQNYQRDINTWKNRWFNMAAKSSTNTTSASGPKNNLIKPRTNLKVQSSFFSVHALDTWNAIPLGKKWQRTQTSSRNSRGHTRATARGLEPPPPPRKGGGGFF